MFSKWLKRKRHDQQAQLFHNQVTWHNDSVQFARLLASIAQDMEFTAKQKQSIMSATQLKWVDVSAVLSRASRGWDAICEQTTEDGFSGQRTTITGSVLDRDVLEGDAPDLGVSHACELTISEPDGCWTAAFFTGPNPGSAIDQGLGVFGESKQGETVVHIRYGEDYMLAVRLIREQETLMVEASGDYQLAPSELPNTMVVLPTGQIETESAVGKVHSADQPGDSPISATCDSSGGISGGGGGGD